jgi:hypothetical protein
MAEWTSVAVQTVNPGESIVFTENSRPCVKGYILHRDDSGAFLMKGIETSPSCGCCCKPKVVDYMVDFGANIAVPTDQTVGEISVAFALDGNTLAGTEMTVTPAAVEEFFNVSRAANVSIWKGCCQTLSIRNTSAIPILVQAANIVFEKK